MKEKLHKNIKHGKPKIILECVKAIYHQRLQVTCLKGHLSEMELCRFRNLTLTLTLPYAYTFWTNDPLDKWTVPSTKYHCKKSETHL